VGGGLAEGTKQGLKKSPKGAGVMNKEVVEGEKLFVDADAARRRRILEKT